MEGFDVYRDIAERTDGSIYIGVVGPVRTGKSTFIKRFMELLVLPNIDNEFKRERAKDGKCYIQGKNDRLCWLSYRWSYGPS
ncbi:MAG: stage sporulation protein [Clostridia bacterium]|nr:stage sporulation protein [Clostridia bacterium]